ncbi:Sodium-dependent phosphate transport protein 1 [Toxocara canis]|uniref:Sodium-dependent phosphate transport protein 1 n=1 Tax=Toxocara canis TaxID=6265 RepID=A0A0B2VI05_TOXCA|nr:Sodium-dependent phosphate transport protein 1 [Toxocara canis]
MAQTSVVYAKNVITFGNSTRYLILALSTLCLALLTSNTLILNFTIICMSEDEAMTNSSQLSLQKTYRFSQFERGLLFSATAYGMLAGTYPVIYFTALLGVRNMFTLFGTISALSTVLLPLCASFGFYFLFMARFIEGFAMASAYPVVGFITSQWSSLKHSGMYISLMSCHLQLGQIFTMPISGALCVSCLGWPAAYYLHGILTLASFIIFFIFFRDSPRLHRNVSAKELSKIELGKAVMFGKRFPSVPYKAIVGTLSIWGVWIASIGGAFGFQIFFQYGPFYLNKVLHFEVENTGFATALPHLLSCIVKVCSGPFSDRASCVSETTRVKLFTTVSQGVMAACFVFLALVPPQLSFLGQVAYTAAIAFSGMNCVGVFKSAQLVARQHAHFVMAILSMINCMVIIVLPLFVSLLAPNNEHSQWAMIFCFICAVVIACNGFFLIVGKGDPAPWTTAEISKIYSVTIPDQLNDDCSHGDVSSSRDHD